MNAEKYSQLASFIWAVADLLRGDFKQSQYGRIVLPFTLLRRMECVLAPTKEAVLQTGREHQNKPDAVREKLLLRASGQQFFNASPLTLATLSDIGVGTEQVESLTSYFCRLAQSHSVSARNLAAWDP